MTDNSGNISIDFLAGFTIFIIAFIWVAALIPSLLINLQSSSIDYDAVAYRTGVILVEDPGWPASPPWESYNDLQKYNMTRFGFAMSKDTPNILSLEKVNRFFCTTAFVYPDDYHQRAIFGEYPYRFNISVLDVERNQTLTVGDLIPKNYGYIRRLAKIKTDSNATIGASYIKAHLYNTTDAVTKHEFSILINNTKLLGDVRNPAYQIDPSREQIIINITDLHTTMNSTLATINLTSINVYEPVGNSLSMVRTFDQPYIDGNSTYSAPPVGLKDNVSLIFTPQFFSAMQLGYTPVYINLTFTLDRNSTFLNNTNAWAPPFDYNYDPANVTQPHLRDAVVEVAVW